VPGEPLDRPEDGPQAQLDSVAAQEPEPSCRHASDEHYRESEQQDGAESESRQQSAQQKPQSGERENAPAQPLPIR
jgi:hypothetical protein